MDEDTRKDSKTRGRVFSIQVYGDNASEIETAALLAAQEFFGKGVPLEIVPDYEASPVATPRPQNPDGKKYTAQVRVRALN